MQFFEGECYHLFNRTNNEERLFKEPENYRYFLERYRYYLRADVATLAYCLMPTHFHFAVRVITPEQDRIRRHIATLLSAYTKAVNVRYGRHGSLFQPRTKAKHINDEPHLVQVARYIHRNPPSPREWQYSSFAELAGRTRTTLVDRAFWLERFGTMAEVLEALDPGDQGEERSQTSNFEDSTEDV